MGMLESMAADVAEIKQMLAEMAAPAGSKPATESKDKPETAAQKKAREKAEKDAAKKDEKPETGFTAEDVRSRFLAIQSAHGDDVAKAAIASFGHSKLAQVIADAENWDSIMEKSATILETGEVGEDEEDNGGL